MTRDDLVSYITGKAQMVEADDVAACQLFVSKRYELIYNSFLWKDALTMVDLAIDPINNPDNAVGIVSLPTQIERVVAIRTATQSMRIHALEEYYRIDWNRFADISDINGLMEFAILNPIWLTCRPQALLNTIIPATFITDIGGVGTRAQFLNLAAGVYTITSATNTLLLATNTSYWQVGLGAPQFFQLSAGVPMQIVLAGPGLILATCPFVGGLRDPNFNITLTYTTPAKSPNTVGAGASVTISSDNPADLSNGATPVSIKVTWRDTTNRYTTTVKMPYTITSTDGFIELESIFKPVSLGNITATLNNPISGYTYTSVVGTMLPTDTRSPGLQRVRLLSAPNQTLTLSVLGKKPFVPLDFGSEVPLIRNLDNCLIAFGLADMLQRGRQYGKAAQQMQEATALLKELSLLEALQAANNQRFIPEAGFGDAFFSPSSQRGIWT